MSIAKGYTKVPNALIRRAKLPSELKLMLIYLLSHDWGPSGCCPSQRRIAFDLGVTDRTVRRQLRQLQQLGYVSISYGSTASRNRYVLDLSSFNADVDVRPIEKPEADTDVRCQHDTDVRPKGTSASSGASYSRTNIQEEASTTVGVDELEVELVRDELAAAGVAEPTRSQLAATRSLTVVRRQIESIRHGSFRNPAAALVAALRYDWAELPAARDAREAEGKRANLKERALLAAGLVAAIVVEPGAREALMRMAPPERQTLLVKARTELGGHVAAEIYGDDRFGTMVVNYALHLVAVEQRASETA